MRMHVDIICRILVSPAHTRLNPPLLQLSIFIATQQSTRQENEQLRLELLQHKLQQRAPLFSMLILFLFPSPAELVRNLDNLFPLKVVINAIKENKVRAEYKVENDISRGKLKKDVWTLLCSILCDEAVGELRGYSFFKHKDSKKPRDSSVDSEIGSGCLFNNTVSTMALQAHQQIA